MFDKLKGNAPIGSTPTEPQQQQPSILSPTKVAPPTQRPRPTQEINILSQNVSITGKIKLDSDIEIDGKIDGEITTKGTVKFSSNAVITAVVKASLIIVEGTVEGDLEATDSIELLSSAKVIGNIKTRSLRIEAGAVFIGQSHTSLDMKPSLDKGLAPVVPIKKESTEKKNALS